jgi:uncharacterized protein YydD (DUF2326 family)
MFLKSLTISSRDKVIRDISFRMGINLIVDESSKEVTGNDVGKTTVLRLVDFCLGSKDKGIYVDPESKKSEYTLVKDFLKNNKVLITMILKDNLGDAESREIILERNFLQNKEIIRRINGVNFSEEEYKSKLGELIFPDHHAEKPSFRQIISHNIRYEDENINNTLKTLDRYTSDVVYETLTLFLLGCDFSKGDQKQSILLELQQEQKFKSRLLKDQTERSYKIALFLLDEEIDKLNKRKSNLNINENFEADLDAFNGIKYAVSRASADVSKLKLRRATILEAQADLESHTSSIDLRQISMIYEQAKVNIGKLDKSFDDLVRYHNSMIREKVDFITKGLPALEVAINEGDNHLKQLLLKENELASTIAKSDSFEELEKLIIELNEKHHKQGEYQSIIRQIERVDKEIARLNEQLETIDHELFSDSFEQVVKTQVDKFNKFFASISSDLYGEQYALNYEVVTKKGQKLYKFNTFNTNFSSGKKQGEISCFDIAYTLFADDENMPCLHFLLNDKKELMHDNQLVGIANLVNDSNVQFIASILKDKLPQELNKEEYFVVKLAPNDKLFRIENQEYNEL